MIGRVLRQPYAKRTPYDVLNSAHFFVNCPGEKFKAVIADIRAEIGANYNDPEHDCIHVIEQPRLIPEPLLPKSTIFIPKLSTKVDPDFVSELVKELDQMPDYRDAPELAIKSGEQHTKVVTVKTGEAMDLEKQTQGIGRVFQVGEIFRKELLRYS